MNATYVQNPPIRKRSLRRTLIRLTILITFTFLGSASWVLYKAKRTPLSLAWLAIDEVTVNSEWPVTVDQVRSWLPALKGKNIFWANATEIIEKIEAKPWVSEVVVKKEYPDRILIDVATKKAVAIGRVDNRLFWLDANGDRIERVSPSMTKSLELPLVTMDSNRSIATSALAVTTLKKLSKLLEGQAEVSQLSFVTGPLFKVYLSNPRAEVTFSTDNWESQTPYLIALLRSALSATPQLQRINLVFPKKAVVSSFLSN